MGTELNYKGYRHAKALISHGKINEGDFRVSASDRAKMLGPEGTDIAEHSRHHLGVKRGDDWEQPETSKDHQYPIVKDGEVYTKALHDARNKAHDAGHESVSGGASELLGHAKLMLDPSERSVIEAPCRPERRFIHFESELRVKDGKNGSKLITGYAAKFGKLSQPLTDSKGRQFVEKIDRAAFEQCVSRCDVRGLRNHDPDLLLGRTKSGTMRIGTDDTGLHYEIDAPDDEVGQSTIKRINRGDLDGSSFSFTTDDDGDEWDDSTDPPTRTLRNVRDLFDVGPVTYPAYLDTEANTRSLDRFRESRELAQRGRLLQLQRIRVMKLRLQRGIL